MYYYIFFSFLHTYTKIQNCEISEQIRETTHDSVTATNTINGQLVTANGETAEQECAKVKMLIFSYIYVFYCCCIFVSRNNLNDDFSDF